MHGYTKKKPACALTLLHVHMLKISQFILIALSRRYTFISRVHHFALLRSISHSQTMCSVFAHFCIWRPLPQRGYMIRIHAVFTSAFSVASNNTESKLHTVALSSQLFIISYIMFILTIKRSC